MGALLSVDGKSLRAFVERIEKLQEEKSAISDDVKEVYGEAKGTGFDPKIIRKIVALRKKDPAKRKEEDAILDLYISALGDFFETPLGAASTRARE
jgi:uncharacterized protein (UPF0335 family)